MNSFANDIVEDEEIQQESNAFSRRRQRALYPSIVAKPIIVQSTSKDNILQSPIRAAQFGSRIRVQSADNYNVEGDYDFL